MTQRDAPPRIAGFDDDDEKTSVGAAPDPEAVRAAPHSPLAPFAPFTPLAPPPLR